MANRARVFAFSLSGVVLLSSFGGCYRPAGSYYPGTGQGYTYISTEMKPLLRMQTSLAKSGFFSSSSTTILPASFQASQPSWTALMNS